MKRKKKCCFRDHLGFVLLSFFVLVMGGVMFRGMGVALGRGDSLFPHVFGFLGLMLLEGIFVYFIYFHQRVVRRDADVVRKKQAEKVKQVGNVLMDFRKARSVEDKLLILGRLETLGVESPEHRQQCLDILSQEQEWMKGCEKFLLGQNLQQWRILGEDFEVEDSVSLEQQKLSRACLRVCERLIREHLLHFEEGVTMMLSLNFKVFPALRLNNLVFSRGSVSLENGTFWQCDFSQSIFSEVSLRFSDLRGCRFLYARMEDVDFEQVLTKGVYFSCDLSRLRNFLVSQFFAAEDWYVNLLSSDQELLFFPVQDSSNLYWGIWSDKDYLRAKLRQQLEKVWGDTAS